MMPLPVRRKAWKMEKVKNFCRTATAQHVIPAQTDHAVESRMSGGFKIARVCRHGRLRPRFGYDRRRIVEQHQGRIWAEKRPDGGARFCFALPIAP